MHISIQQSPKFCQAHTKTISPKAQVIFTPTLETSEAKAKTITESIKQKGITQEELLKRFKKYDEGGSGKVPLEVFYVVFMRSGVVLTNKEVELLAKQWDPSVGQKGEIEYDKFLKHFFS
eukprot:TRINITY_DN2061_c0_g2_i1.p2 TRINITY_DN2061_c0_g2~~TRINITY_DN2061_c0_g2_i1.p2  ORF type:complete len:120 (-),score=21.16 TRINITY_DN2061_c0_g2_i1:68-427(-)